MNLIHPSPEEQLQTFARDASQAAKRGFFGRASHAFAARAPGRLDVMGGVADYSGSLVLEGTLGPGAFAAVAAIPEPEVRIRTVLSGHSEIASDVEIAANDLCAEGEEDFARISRMLLADEATSWSALVAGCIPVLMADSGRRPGGGFAILIRSEVPIAEGVASSAAIEVATMMALCAAAEIDLPPTELARLCQIVENRIGQAPCGIMDQMTVACGMQGKLLRLRCQPAQIEGQLNVPDGIHLFGINSGVKHSVAGSRYGQTRVGSFIAVAMLGAAGVSVPDGYLCNISVPEFRQVRSLLPKSITGSEFRKLGLDYTDTATSPQPETVYFPRQSADHAVYENHRVKEFAELMARGDDASLRRAGRLMYASHWSYSAKARLGSVQTDQLVALLRHMAPDKGVLGAKITGGGCGGTVAVMAQRPAEDIFVEVSEAYKAATEHAPGLIWGSSPGAAQFGVRRVEL